MAIVAKADRPTDLPIVESCVQQVKDQGNSKESAIRVCTAKLRQAGRIRKEGDQWVQVSGGGNGETRESR